MTFYKDIDNYNSNRNKKKIIARESKSDFNYDARHTFFEFYREC